MFSKRYKKWISSTLLTTMLMSLFSSVTVAAAEENTVPELFVSEIHPDVEGTDDYEFFEVYNNSNKTLSLNEYSFIYRYPTSTPDATFTFGSKSLAPEQVMVFWYNPKGFALTDFNTKYGVSLTDSQVVQVAGFSGFSNTADRTVVIKNGQGTEISKSSYAAATDVGAGLGDHYKLPASGTQTDKFAVKSLPTPGALATEQIPSVHYQFPDLPASEPPVITHTPVTQGSSSEDLVITATITDADDTPTAAVYYKKPSDAAFASVPMTVTEGTTFSAMIPKAALSGTELQYYIEASDAVNHVKSLTYTAAIEQSGLDFSKVPVLLVTELVPDSVNVNGVNSDAYEFVELYNNTTRPIALKDYKLIYRYTDESSPDAAWELPGSAVIPPLGTVAFWIKNGANDKLAAADFNANYGTNLTENTNLFQIDGGGGMANGGKRKVVVASKAGKEIAEAFYENDAQTIENKGIFYQYPTDGSNQMHLYNAGVDAATPGSVETGLVPVQPAPAVNKLPVIQHTPPASGSIDQDLAVQADIVDEDSGDTITASLHYKVGDASDYTSMPMAAGAGDTFSASIPKEALTGTELQYYIQADDGTDTVKSTVYNVTIETGNVDFSKLSPLMVTEIVPDSTNVGTADGYEFVEVYNNTDQTVNFKNYKLQYRYTDSGPDADVVWPTDSEEILIPSKQTMVFWVINSQNKQKTVADFNAVYGTSLIEGTNIVKMYSDGMANGGKRGIVITTNTKTDISAVYYDNDAETVANKGIFYKYSPTGSITMIKYSAGVDAATPGSVSSVQVPLITVKQPLDTTNPTYKDLTNTPEIDKAKNLLITAEAHDENLVKSVALFYRSNLDAQYTKRYLTESFDDTLYHYTIYSPELIGRDYIEYYYVVSDGKNEVTSEKYRTTINGNADHSDLRLNVKDDEVLAGTKVIKATSENAPASELHLTIDQNEATDGSYAAVEQDAYFAFEANGVNYYFKNGVTAGQEILSIFQDPINSYTTLTVPIESERLKGGSNIISIRAGTKASPFDDRAEENKDDFTVRNVRLVFADGTEIFDDRYKNRDTVIPMGDSAGKNPVVDFNFVIPDELLASKAYALDTTKLTDGNHTVKVSHSQYGEKSVHVTVDNTAPVITTTLEDGKEYRGPFMIDAEAKDALAGVEDVKVWLDETPVKLPYATSSKDLAAGEHVLMVQATDKVGNHSQKEVTFSVPDENPLKPELVSPADGATGIDRNAELTVKVKDPTSDKMDVSFYRGFKYDAANKDGFEGFRNAADVEPPKEIAPAGEKAMSEDDYAQISAVDGQYLTDDSTTQFPYQRFQVQLDPSVKDTDQIELSWKGKSLEGRKVSLYAWSPSEKKWNSVDSVVAGVEDFSLGAWVTAGDYEDNHALQVMVQDELPASQEDYDFSFAWMSDTQYYSESYPYIYEDIVHWIADNKEKNKIDYVIHTGDIVDEADKEIQWQRADADMKVLEDAKIPYGVLAGNHDVDHQLGAYDYYWNYFGEDRFKDQPSYGGSLDNNRGHYDLISSHGNDFIMVYMGWGIRDSDIDWMNEVLAKYPNRKAILNFHEFLLVSGNRAPIADKIFEEVVKKNKNVFAVLSGHYHNSELLVDDIDDDGDGKNDRKVYQMLSDYQGGPEGGQGYIKLLQFDIAHDKMYVKTYSPYLDDYNFYDEDPSKDEFTLDVDLTPQVKRVSTDYMGVNVYSDQPIGKEEQVTSGEQASATWSNLSAGAKYQWYAAAEDAYTGKGLSDIWSFTTADGGTDATAPTWTESSLTASAIGKTTLKLTWTGASDNIGVTKYKVYKDNVELATVTGTSYDVTGLTANTSYTFKVEAGDASGNWSTNGPSKTERTSADTTTGGGNNGNNGNAGNGQTPEITPVKTEYGASIKGSASGETFTLPAKTLDQAIAMLTGQGGQTIAIAADSPGIANVELPARALLDALKTTPNLTISIQLDGASYDLPISALNLPATIGTDAKIIIKIDQVSSALSQTIADKAAQAGVQLAGTPVQYGVFLQSNGTTQELHEFGHTYVSRTIEIDRTLDASKSTAVLYNEETGEFTFVPATFKTVNGHTIVTIQRNGNSVYAVAQLNKTFGDLASHWAKTDVELMASKLIVKGLSNDTFGPNAAVTRAEFAAMVVRALGISEDQTGAAFNDVDGKDWFAGAVGAAVKAGLAKGYEDGSFKPNASINREEMAVMISRALAFTGKQPNTNGTLPLDVFKDKSAIEAWAAAFVAQAVEAKIIEGNTNGNFAPDNKATRAEAAVMLKRLLDYADFI
ncbi:S-layer homology domain-containing protein [Paenibacillus sacheonensis]|uniref:Metallophosphoesterase n=1 Tax=Paenibacillus sacheonensis TaxID=742054 RepID=A0A7X4YLY3_9BACL|nr:S-layer homology domain-containing protein [Paenibacillus sacheonensis]MBM7565959.1 putative phosphodiesterase [Paenibacillus sacheonensis]NBC68727.1 metallophosphoesterase [Paenibacillus sacheonensis]